MRLNIICDRDWICRKYAEILHSSIPESVLTVSHRDHMISDTNYIRYYLPYYLIDYYVPKSRDISISYMTHYVPSGHTDMIENKPVYDSIAKRSDYCIVMSDQHLKYVSDIRKDDKVYLVRVPILSPFSCRPLRVLWSGRDYRKTSGCNRKRVDWVDRVGKLSWVQLIKTSSQLDIDTVSQLYRKVDIVLITSLYEAGPLSLLEAIASGTPVLIGRGVGMADEISTMFPEMVHLFEPDSYDNMIHVLKSIHKKRKKYSDTITSIYSKDNFIKDHMKIFDLLKG